MDAPTEDLEIEVFEIGQVCTVHNYKGFHALGWMYAVVSMNSKKVVLGCEFVVISHPIDDLVLGRGATIVDAIDDFLKYCLRENCIGFVSPTIYDAHDVLSDELAIGIWGRGIFPPYLKKASLLNVLDTSFEFRAREI